MVADACGRRRCLARDCDCECGDDQRLMRRCLTARGVEAAAVAVWWWSTASPPTARRVRRGGRDWALPAATGGGDGGSDATDSCGPDSPALQPPRAERVETCARRLCSAGEGGRCSSKRSSCAFHRRMRASAASTCMEQTRAPTHTCHMSTCVEGHHAGGATTNQLPTWWARL